MSKSGILSMENNKKHSIALVPKDFVTAPLFPAVLQDAPRELSVGDRKYTIGYKDNRLWKIGIPKAFDIRHGRMIFLLLSLMHKTNGVPKGEIDSATIYKLCMMYYGAAGKKNYEMVEEILGELKGIVVDITGKDGVRETFTVLQFDSVEDHLDSKGRVLRKRRTVKKMRFSEEFNRYFIDCERLYIRVDVLCSLKSAVAASIYTYIPSRAHHHTLCTPFRISFTNLIEQITGGKRSYKYKTERLRYFLDDRSDEGKGKKDVFAELDGREIRSGILRSRYEDAGDDYNAIFWTEKHTETTSNAETSIRELLKKAGISDVKYTAWMNKGEISEYGRAKLEALSIDVDKNLKFYLLCQNILGEMFFDSVVGQVSSEHKSGSNMESTEKILAYRLRKNIELAISKNIPNEDESSLNI